MRKHAAAKAALLAFATFFVAGSAMAADLSMAPAPMMVPGAAPIINWTGFYVGVNGGYGTGRADSTNTPYDGNISGWFAGGQLGYNAQFTGNWVAGVEADVDWSGLKGTINSSSPTITQSIDWFGTIRGRLGYAFGNVLPYVTGGFAFGGATRTSSFTSASQSLGVTGYTIGAGVEVGLANNWSIKGEYQYLNFGAVTYNNIPANPNVALAAHTFRIGLNKRF